MNRIDKAFEQDRKLLSIYFTAGYPQLNDTVDVIRELDTSGVDMIEIGLPFSDPLADGPTIQDSSTRALHNGMNTQLLFEQLEGIRELTDLPLIIMGYFNPVLQFGFERFCQRCSEIGIDGLILPDLPLEEYNSLYRATMEQYGLYMIFLVTPQTSEERIRQIDQASGGFIYLVSTASTTGAQNGFGGETEAYFKRIAEMGLKLPRIVGFGISSHATFKQATTDNQGAIIGSAFIKMLAANGVKGVNAFVQGIRQG